MRKHTSAVENYVFETLKELGTKHAVAIACTIRLARLCAELVLFDKARVFYEWALRIYSEEARLRAASKPGALGDHARILCGLLKLENNLPACVRALHWALSFRQESLGPTHEKTVETEYLLGKHLRELGKFEDAYSYFKLIGDLNETAKAHFSAGRLQIALELQQARCRPAASQPRRPAARRAPRAAPQMAVAIGERVCDKCLARGDLQVASSGLAPALLALGDAPAAEAVYKVPPARGAPAPPGAPCNRLPTPAQRLVSETERRLGAGHPRFGSALLRLAACCHFGMGRQPELAEPCARRGWAILEAAPGLAGPEAAVEIANLWKIHVQAPHLDPAGTFVRARRPGPRRSMRDILNEFEEKAWLEQRIREHKELQRKEEEQRKRKEEEQERARERAFQERRRQEEERERAQQEAERAERAKRDAKERAAAQRHMKGAQWAPARKLLDALLERSPDDVEARLLRIECMAGAGQLEAAAQEAERAERELAGSDRSADALRRVQERRRQVEAELRRREEATRREEAKRREGADREERRAAQAREAEKQRREEAQQREEARRGEEERRREQEQRREQERQEEQRRREQLWREEQERKEARRREQERRQEERRREEEERQLAERRREEEARAQELQRAETERRQELEERRRQEEEEERRREEEARAREQQQAEAERQREEGQRRRGGQQLQRAPPAARRGAAACRFFAAGFCRDGDRCRFLHGPVAKGPAPAAEPRPAEAGPSSHPSKQAQACRFFARGSCRDGARCRYLHESRAAVPAAAPEEVELDRDCAICLGPLSAGPPATALPCRHRFHGPCIKKWRASPLAHGCPECRRPFDGPAPPAPTGAAPSTPARPPRAAATSRGPGPASPPPLQPASPATSSGGSGASAPASPLQLSAPLARPDFPRRPTRPYLPPALFPA
eukprot:tig00000241_g20948.t1